MEHETRLNIAGSTGTLLIAVILGWAALSGQLTPELALKSLDTLTVFVVVAFGANEAKNALR